MKDLRAAAISLAVFTVTLGLVYPAVMTVFARLAFPHQAEGSLVEDHGRIVGSELIEQPFDAPGYLWGRPSATAPFADNAMSSGATNFGPSSAALRDAVKRRIDALHRADPSNLAPVPIDLVTASASGLDPDISPAAAFDQAERIARARGLGEAMVRALIAAHIQPPQLAILGEARVNVLAVNRALDAKTGPPATAAVR